MSQTFHLAGLSSTPTLRVRQTVGGQALSWTGPLVLNLAAYPPFPSGALAAALAPFITVERGGNASGTPDLSAISVSVSAGTIPRQKGVAFYLVSADPDFWAFCLFGTAKWTFSQHAAEDYAFAHLADELAGDTAGEAFGPYVAHAYVTGPRQLAQSIETAALHEWSVTLSYPGVPDRTITHTDGAKDLRATEVAGIDVFVNAIEVHDDDWWFSSQGTGAKTVWWAPAGTYASAAAFRTAVLAMDADVSGVNPNALPDETRFKMGDLGGESATLTSASWGFPGEQKGRLLIQAGTTHTVSSISDKITCGSIRVDRFGPALDADPIIDATGLTSNIGEAVDIGARGELANVWVRGPYDATNPGKTTPALQYNTDGVAGAATGWLDGTVFRCRVTGFAHNLFCSNEMNRCVVADAEFGSWYSYGMFLEDYHYSVMAGVRIAQPAGTLHATAVRRYYNTGSGDANSTLESQQDARDAFDWGDLTGRMTINNGTIYGKRPATIPEEYQIFEPDGVTLKIALTATNRVWGKHPYDVANGGTAAWDWIVEHHNGLIFPGFFNAWQHVFNDSYDKAPHHGPIRIPSGTMRAGMHQCELRSLNGWSPGGSYSTAAYDPVTGRNDSAAANIGAFAVQPVTRLWSSGIGAIPTDAEAGFSGWRLACYGGAGLGISTQSPEGHTDSKVAHSGAIFDGCILNPQLADDPLFFTSPSLRTALRNSILYWDGDNTGGKDIRFVQGGGLAVDPDTSLDQSPIYAFNNTFVKRGDTPNKIVYFIRDLPGARPVIEWNNARFKSGTEEAGSDTVPTYTNTTNSTPTVGTKPFAHAPAAGSDMLADTEGLQPKYDLEGGLRPAIGAVGAFE